MSREGKILLWSNNIWNFSDGMLGPLFAVFAARIGGNILDISWAWAIYLITTGIFTILVGKIADRRGHKVIMMTGYVLTAVLTFAYLLIDTPLQLFLLQAGLGLALALANPTWSALYDKYSGDGEKDGMVWGLAMGEAKIVTGLAMMIGGVVVTQYSFEALFISMGVLQTIGALYTAQLFFLKSA